MKEMKEFNKSALIPSATTLSNKWGLTEKLLACKCNFKIKVIVLCTNLFVAYIYHRSRSDSYVYTCKFEKK
jgi:hypothetical protein